MRRDPRVARQDHARAAVNHALQPAQVDAVPLVFAHRHVIPDIRSQVFQRRHEQRGGRLPVYVEVAPNADLLPLRDSILNSRRRLRHIRQFKRRRATIIGMIQEGEGALRVGDPTPRQRLRDQRMPANDYAQPFDDGYRSLFRLDPGLQNTISPI